MPCSAERPPPSGDIIRSAVAGSKRCMALLMSEVACRRTVRSSSIQKERPLVATTRSLPLTTKSEMGTVGMLSCSRCHDPPSSKDTYTPVSVPA